jgi:hypothetical protein
MKTSIRSFALPLGLTLFSAASLQAQPSAHYVPGSEGIKGASLPPPGVYVRDYNFFYESSRVNNNDGNKVDAANAKALIYANVPRVIWITDTTLLGGFVGVDALLPLQYTDLNVTTPGGPYSDSTFGIGDLFAESTLTWHPTNFDIAIGLGVWAPTGDSAEQPTVRAGAGFWTVMLTAGATYYFDQEKQWSISALSRYEFNTEQRDSDITPGQAFTLEWGIAHTFRKTIDVGIVGYYQQQTTSDSGSGASSDLDRVAAIGPEVGMFYPDYKLGWTLRYEYEFAAANRLQGQAIVFTLTKVF